MSSGFLFAQSSANKTILQLDGKKLTLADFEKYCKSNNYMEGSKIKNIKQSIDEYIVYSLKLTEAENQEIDKTTKFKREMEKFRSEIAAPYLNSSTVNEELVNRELDRMKIVHEASQILIPIPLIQSNDNSNEIFSKDTLASYQKAMEIYSLCLSDNYFDNKDANSDYKSYDLGIIRIFSAPMSMENAIYGMEVGAISKPVRSQYGYHILRVNKRYPESQMTSSPQIKHNIIARLKQLNPTLYFHPILSKMKTDNEFSPRAELYIELRKAAEELYPTSKAFI